QRPARLADALDRGQPALEGREPALVGLLGNSRLARALDRDRGVLAGQLELGQAVFDEGQSLGTGIAGRSANAKSPGDVSKSGRDADRIERRPHNPTP